jgi:dolichol-phosphate mannosyltransferase
VEGIDRLYRLRYSEAQRRAREAVWQALCRHFFQRYVGETDTILDLGCGLGEFSRFIHAGRKIAVDSNPDAAAGLPPDIEFRVADARHLDFIAAGVLDVCLTSNFFEHLPSKQDLDAVLAEVHRLLRPGGSLIVLQPNIRYAPGAYWDYYDHHLPLSERSCAEALGKAGFEVVEVIGRFLPFTTCSAWPKHPLLVRLYLRARPLWRVLGRQFLIVARRP